MQNCVTYTQELMRNRAIDMNMEYKFVIWGRGELGNL